MVPLLKTLIRPVLDNGTSRSMSYLLKMSRADSLRGLIGMKNLNDEDRQKTLNLPSLEFRRTRGDMIVTYKIIHGLHDLSCSSSLFTLNLSSGTRGHPDKLIKPPVNTNPYSHFFTNRVINILE